ncbi:MAG TPA: phage portal protein [Ignavibacteria bacterium]|nr:phage portal protein [Ignavibacteria bacterium]
MNILTKFLIKYLKRKGYSIGLSDYNLFAKTFSGINSSSSAYSGWVAACADVWGKYFAKVKFRLYDSFSGDEVISHPVTKLFTNPNMFQTWWEIKYRIAQNFIIFGNSYLLKLRDSIGVPREVVQLHPDRINSYPQNIERIDYYEYNTGTSITRLNREDVIHFRYPDPTDHVKGRPVISNILNQLEVDKFQTAYQKKFYREGGFYGAAFSTEQKMSRESFERMVQHISDRYTGGSENAYRVAVFEQGLKPIPGAYSIKEMDISSQRSLTQKEICAAFQVNKLLLGESELIQRGNADTVIYLFCTSVIDPIMDYIEDVLTKELVVVDFGEDYFIKHDKVASRDIELDLKYYESGLKHGWLSSEEVRELEGFSKSIKN